MAEPTPIERLRRAIVFAGKADSDIAPAIVADARRALAEVEAVVNAVGPDDAWERDKDGKPYRCFFCLHAPPEHESSCLFAALARFGKEGP